jgi:hypothetical protein
LQCSKIFTYFNDPTFFPGGSGLPNTEAVETMPSSLSRNIISAVIQKQKIQVQKVVPAKITIITPIKTAEEC